jgi:hypothetical protein
MSKRRMLMLFEKNGRGRSGLAAALPGQRHSRSGSLLPGRISNRPVQKPRSEELRKLIRGPLPGPSGHPAVPPKAARRSYRRGCW